MNSLRSVAVSHNFQKFGLLVIAILGLTHAMDDGTIGHQGDNDDIDDFEDTVQSWKRDNIIKSRCLAGLSDSLVNTD